MKTYPYTAALYDQYLMVVIDAAKGIVIKKNYTGRHNVGNFKVGDKVSITDLNKRGHNLCPMSIADFNKLIYPIYPFFARCSGTRDGEFLVCFTSEGEGYVVAEKESAWYVGYFSDAWVWDQFERCSIEEFSELIK